MEAQIMNALIILGIVYFLVIILMIVAHWKIFVKAGQPGWAIFVPIYSLIVFLKIIKKEWTAMFLLFIPFYNFVVMIQWVNQLSKAFGKGTGFTLGLIFFPFIFMPILAFGDAQYVYANQEKIDLVD